jgi:7-cyano-7-deazaguanine synthase in queuosine biosynthesis
MNKNQPRTYTILCGELCAGQYSDVNNPVKLSWHDVGDMEGNVSINYSKFVDDITTLPQKNIDLLEIAAYVFSADRAVRRGERDSVDNESWSRSFHFCIPVRDIDFWNDSQIKSVMSSALEFMTGDRKYIFDFHKYQKDPIHDKSYQPLLFSELYNPLGINERTKIMLFSGGLDSLAGAIDCLNNDQNFNVCLVGHRSNNSIKSIQDKLIKCLKDKYGEKRIKYYGFECHNKNYLEAAEETQRTRMFLFSAISFAICNFYKKNEVLIYENGITSINLPKEGDEFLARASRTTHPKTIGLLQKFYNIFSEDIFFSAPYIRKTKTDIMQVFPLFNETVLIQDTISCSATRTKPQSLPHCGCCSQCIDRRFAIYAANLDESGSADLYANDFIEKIPNDETKRRLYITLRFATMEDMKTRDDFVKRYLNEIMDIIEYWPGDNPDDKVDELYELLKHYSDSVLSALKKMQTKYEDLILQIPPDSLLEIIAKRDYLKTPILTRVIEIDKILATAIPSMFQRERPKNENDFNDKVQAILSTQGKFDREYPILKFGITNYIADHSQDVLLIEAKYIRGKTTPSVVTKGIAGDITLAPNVLGLFFIVYDPDRNITNDIDFIKGFEEKRKDCYVRIYR